MIGHGATLSGSVSGTIGYLTNIDWSGVTVDDIDITTFDSEDQWRQFEPGLKDAGELSGDLNFNDLFSILSLRLLREMPAGL